MFGKLMQIVSLGCVLLVTLSPVMGHSRGNRSRRNHQQHPHNNMNMIVPVSSSSSTVVASPPGVAVAATEESSGGSNGVSQMVGYVKDSIVRSIDGCKTMWSNHGQCNAIRSKQKLYKQSLKDQWLEEGALSGKQINQLLKTESGGISFEEYQFLQQGKVDRSKVTQLMFMSWGAPRFLPYYIMFFPDMLPSPFLPAPKVGAETKWSELSRSRSHAVVKTLLDLERDARQVPALAKLNFFGRKAQQQSMERTHQIGLSTYQLLMSPPTAVITKKIVVKNPKKGAEEKMEEIQTPHGPTTILRTIDNLIYGSSSVDSSSTTTSNKKEGGAFSAQETNLSLLPKSIIKGMGSLIDGGKSNPTDAILPTYFGRRKVLAHLQKVKECDDFLVKEKVDIASLGTKQLRDVCSDRLYDCMGRTDEEMKSMLREWLDLVVTQPQSKVAAGGVSFNDNLARTALMCYYSLESAQDARAASYLPGALFRGNIYK